jgi:hypothetical protein
MENKDILFIVLIFMLVIGLAIAIYYATKTDPIELPEKTLGEIIITENVTTQNQTELLNHIIQQTDIIHSKIIDPNPNWEYKWAIWVNGKKRDIGVFSPGDLMAWYIPKDIYSNNCVFGAYSGDYGSLSTPFTIQPKFTGYKDSTGGHGNERVSAGSSISSVMEVGYGLVFSGNVDDYNTFLSTDGTTWTRSNKPTNVGQNEKYVWLNWTIDNTSPTFYWKIETVVNGKKLIACSPYSFEVY